MGIHAHLYVATEAISDSCWRMVYEESLHVLAQWPAPPLGVRSLSVAGQEVVAYTRRCEHEAGWSIVGDARSMRCAERFQFPRALPRRYRGTLRDVSLGSAEDLLVRIVTTTREDAYTGPTNLFGNKTQGLPYHALVVAIALLVENRVPGAAIAMGDIDASDALTACRALGRIFGESFSGPVVLDEVRVRDRVAAHVLPTSLNVFLADFRPNDPATASLAADVLTVLHNGPRARLESGLVQATVVADVNDLVTEARQFLVQVAAATQEIADKLELDARLDSGALRVDELLRMVVRATRSGIWISEAAWRKIERADVKELRFLLALACVAQPGATFALARTALFENAALRRSLRPHWSTASPLALRTGAT